MKTGEKVSLTRYNTFGIRTKARYFAEIRDDRDFSRITDSVLFKNVPSLVLGGGSNILFTGDYDGLIIKISTRGIRRVSENEREVLIKAKAGERWHELVNYCVKRNFGGLENLSLIPGNVGAAPIQNIGAYGVEQKDCFHEAEVLDVDTGKTMILNAMECRFGYRNSIFKEELKGKVIVVSVTYRLNKNPELNLNYGTVGEELEKMKITHPNIRDVSEAICRIRRSKLPDPGKTGNAGSFFKNPMVSEKTINELILNYPELVSYPSGPGTFKLSAGWLIEHAGWKGFRRDDAGVSETHALVLINYGKAKGSEIAALANEIRDSVKAGFGITLEPEVNII